MPRTDLILIVCSLDGIVRVFSVDNFENFHTVERNNNIGTHLSTFKYNNGSFLIVILNPYLINLSDFTH